MRFLIDRCAGHRLADWLRDRGHDVVEMSQRGPDPGDQAVLGSATSDRRVLVTLDTDFGELIFSRRQPHCGLVRLPDVRSLERITLLAEVLERHADDLEGGAVVTVRGDRIRVSRSP